MNLEWRRKEIITKCEIYITQLQFLDYMRFELSKIKFIQYLAENCIYILPLY